MAKGPSHIRHSRPFLTGVNIHALTTPSYSIPCTARKCTRDTKRNTSAVDADTNAEIDMYTGAMIVCFVLGLRMVALGRMWAVEELEPGVESVKELEGEIGGKEKEKETTGWRWDAVRMRLEG
jgi:hypothetical protein